MIRVAVIGCGKIAQVRHLPEYATNPTHSWWPTMTRTAGGRTRWPPNTAERSTDSYFDLLKDPEIDAVSVCVENRSHAEMTTAALYAGKHVLCEKPMAVTLAECESMVAAAEFNNRHLMIGHNMRFDPVQSPGQGAAGAGVIGDVITFRTGSAPPGRRAWSMEATGSSTRKRPLWALCRILASTRSI